MRSQQIRYVANAGPVAFLRDFARQARTAQQRMCTVDGRLCRIQIEVSLPHIKFDLLRDAVARRIQLIGVSLRLLHCVRGFESVKQRNVQRNADGSAGAAVAVPGGLEVVICLAGGDGKIERRIAPCRSCINTCVRCTCLCLSGTQIGTGCFGFIEIIIDCGAHVLCRQFCFQWCKFQFGIDRQTNCVTQHAFEFADITLRLAQLQTTLRQQRLCLIYITDGRQTSLAARVGHINTQLHALEHFFTGHNHLARTEQLVIGLFDVKHDILNSAILCQISRQQTVARSPLRRRTRAKVEQHITKTDTRRETCLNISRGHPGAAVDRCLAACQRNSDI